MGNYFSQSQPAQEQPPVHLGDLQSYITKELASTTFQTKGSYAFDPHTHGGLYLTKDQISKAYQTAGSYAFASSLAAYAPLVHQHSEYLLTSDFNQSAGGYALASQLSDYQTKGDYALASQLSDYQTKGDYVSTTQLTNYQTAGNYALASQLSNYQTAGNYALASQLSNYQAKGDYAAASHNHDGAYVAMDASGNAQISGNKVMEFGRGVTGKQIDAGKIGYGTLDSGASLNIVGAGTASGSRQVRVWDNLTVDRNLTVSGSGINSGNLVRLNGSNTATTNYNLISAGHGDGTAFEVKATGDTTMNGNLINIGNPTTSNTNVRGNLTIAGNTVALAQEFKVGGVDTKFYPVVFNVSSSWNERGNYKIYIQRSSVHLDSTGKGSLNLQIDGHTSNWGNGAQYLNYQFSQSRLRFIGNIQEDPNSSKIIVTLRGNTTYRWVADGAVLENANTAGTAITLQVNNPPPFPLLNPNAPLPPPPIYNILDVISTPFDRDTSSSTSISDIRFAGDATIAGNATIAGQFLPKYTHVPYVDANGNDRKSLTNQTWAQCKAECDADALCKGFQTDQLWPNGTGSCWIKSAVHNKTNADNRHLFTKNY